MDRHPVVPHDLGIQVMVVDLQRDELPDQGILAGLDEEIAFRILDGKGFPRQGGEILLEFRSQGVEAVVLRPQHDGSQQGRQHRQQPFHSSTPSGMKAE